MNAEPQILEIHPDAPDPNQQSLPARAEPAPESSEPAHPALGADNRGNGKVARLPKPVRDRINNGLLDGVSHPDIIQRLGKDGENLRPNNIHQWKKHGHQDWLLQRQWLDHISSKAEFSSDILAAPDSSGLHEAGLRIAASQMFDQLLLFGAAAASVDSPAQPEKFARLVNALSRLTREALAFQKYRDAAAKAAAQLKQLDPDRELSDREHELWADRLDAFFKKPRRLHTQAPPQPLAPTETPAGPAGQK